MVIFVGEERRQLIWHFFKKLPSCLLDLITYKNKTPFHEITEFEEIEQEIIILRSVLDMINEMVNYSVFEKPCELIDTNLMFKTDYTQRIFNILLVDFLSNPGKEIFGKRPVSYLGYLRRICKNPKLSTQCNSIEMPIEQFRKWLEKEVEIKDVWFSSISISVNIRIKRVDFLKICGNISKHNFTRLDQDVKKVESIFKNSKCPINRQQGYMVLPEFYEWFHDNIFNYHASKIAEFLNNIRWGIFKYLQVAQSQSDESERIGRIPTLSSVPGFFDYPESCRNPLAQHMYVTLMEEVKDEPYFPKFTTNPIFDKRY